MGIIKTVDGNLRDQTFATLSFNISERKVRAGTGLHLLEKEDGYFELDKLLSFQIRGFGIRGTFDEKFYESNRQCELGLMVFNKTYMNGLLINSLQATGNGFCTNFQVKFDRGSLVEFFPQTQFKPYLHFWDNRSNSPRMNWPNNIEDVGVYDFQYLLYGDIRRPVQ